MHNKKIEFDLSRNVLRYTNCRNVGDGQQSQSQSQRNVTNIVLIGATGDLAKRYLWQGFFSLFIQETNERNIVKVYPTARESVESGQKKIDDILKESLKCSESEHSNWCADNKRVFVDQSVKEYHRLKTDQDFISLCQIMGDDIAAGEREEGLIFYLSVPPFAYTQLAQRIDSFCRRPEDKRSWIRIVLEKPFGSDLASAQELARSLSNYFEEKEIYRIDHYLGKTGVVHILEFRYSNHNLYKDLWNSDHIERVEIVLKEKNDCEGRTSFYDHYGVIRDVMQNHMTELLALVAMELPDSLNDRISIMQNKVRLLKEIKAMDRWSGVIGQYKDYNLHYHQENKKDEDSNTPTFAAVSIFINNARWNGVPFILVSGKQLDERTAYVRIVFKNNVHNVQSGTSHDNNCDIRQVVFNIQGEKLTKPGLLLSSNLPNPKSFHPFTSIENKKDQLFGCSADSFNAFIFKKSADAYTTLISAVYHEQKNLFVGMEDLLSSWKVWSYFLDTLKREVPRQYDQKSLDVLNFVNSGERLEFSLNNDDGSCDANKICKSTEPSANYYKQDKFRNSDLVTGTKSQVIETLANKIIGHALREVSAKGVFHLALSGGTSPVMLYETLAFIAKEFPWHHSHVWFVDERCVPLNSQESNFDLIYKKLLQHVPISPLNFHPMHVMLKGGLCEPRDEGAEHYEAELGRFLLSDNQLDFVVLGLGSDGHTASLFPHQSALNEKNKFVTLSESSQDSGVKERMTMTLDLLNKAKSVAVLALGGLKRDIVKTISSVEVDVWNYPVTGLNPENGELTWYIDNVALESH
ncbi:GDH/6PGL endoplasmic bifunctional protein [Stylophora pistillata]|uniref:GDH/6PGL endoplasmic bifunctional protein n=1 Tax=Stylophora pistillata TaxID=50429 RepID=A0A2B4SD53_STYPI|nr:GDH/6PGL endoplasmic bifunctional protein [Stylophora pistillata]